MPDECALALRCCWPPLPGSWIPHWRWCGEIRITGHRRGDAGDGRSGLGAADVKHVALSPLNAQIGDPISVIPVEVTRAPASIDISIDSIGVNGVPISPVGVMTDGQLEIPDETEVGWYKFGPSPGEPGVGGVAAHVSWNDTIGPFFRLEEVQPGDTVRVGLEDGTTRTYAVVERVQYVKTELPAERIWTSTGPDASLTHHAPDVRRSR